MKKFLLLIFLSVILIVSISYAEFKSDLIVTSPNGIWTDSRAYSTLNDAISAVGTNERTIKIVSPQTVTTLTVPSNVTLEFARNGSITNSGQLTINTKNIIAPNRQIFTGVGNIDFATGSTLKTGWFSNIETAFALTSNDEVTLIVSKSQSITASYSPGNNVHLKWEDPGNILTVNSGVTVGNLKNIKAGNYQIFAGAGDFDFIDGAELKLNWFNRLESVIAWVESEEVTIIVNEDSIVQTNTTTASNENIKVIPGGELIPDAGVTLTISSFEAGLDQVFSGNGDIVFTSGYIGSVYPQWWYSGSGYWTSAIQAAIDSVASTGGEVFLVARDYEIDDKLIIYNRGICLSGPVPPGRNISTYPEAYAPRGATIINKSGDKDAILIGKVSTGVSDITIQNLSIYGDKDTATAGNGIVLDSLGYAPNGVHNITLKNVAISHVEEDGLVLNDNVFECAFYDVRIHNCDGSGMHTKGTAGNLQSISLFGCSFTANGDWGVKHTWGFNISYHGCFFISNTTGGVQLPRASNLYGCYIENETIGTQLKGYSASVSGGSIWSCTTGIYADNNSIRSSMSDIFFTGNTTDIDIDITNPNITYTAITIGKMRGSNSGELIISDNSYDTYYIGQSITTLTANDNTPNVNGYNHRVFKTANTVATTYLALYYPSAGKSIKIIIGDANTAIDFTGTTLKGNNGVDWSPSSGDWMECVSDGTNWYCSCHDCTP